MHLYSFLFKHYYKYKTNKLNRSANLSLRLLTAISLPSRGLFLQLHTTPFIEYYLRKLWHITDKSQRFPHLNNIIAG